MTVMIDCTGANVPMVHGLFPSAVYVAGYFESGTSDIQWTPNDWNYWPKAIHITIDQGYLDPPITHAIVRDVENGAWTIDAAMDMSNWTTPRPTMYGSRNTIDAAIAKGWKGDVWLAAPGWQKGDNLPSGVNVVAVQNVFANSYDSSIILDPTWPFLNHSNEVDMINGFVVTGDDEFVPFPAGSFKQVIQFADFANGTARVAMHSKAHGYSQIEIVQITGHEPVSTAFKETDVDAVSISAVTVPHGWTMA